MKWEGTMVHAGPLLVPSLTATKSMAMEEEALEFSLFQEFISKCFLIK
jgi:hypothetical protein